MTMLHYHIDTLLVYSWFTNRHPFGLRKVYNRHPFGLRKYACGLRVE